MDNVLGSNTSLADTGTDQKTATNSRFLRIRQEIKVVQVPFTTVVGVSVASVLVVDRPAQDAAITSGVVFDDVDVGSKAVGFDAVSFDFLHFWRLQIFDEFAVLQDQPVALESEFHSHCHPTQAYAHTDRHDRKGGVSLSAL